MGPTRYPAKRVPELEKSLEAVYRQWRGVLWRRQVLLSCKLINKCFKKTVWFLFGQTTYLRVAPSKGPINLPSVSYPCVGDRLHSRT
jgi:hypothetical protein